MARVTTYTDPSKGDVAIPADPTPRRMATEGNPLVRIAELERQVRSLKVERAALRKTIYDIRQNTAAIFDDD